MLRLMIGAVLAVATVADARADQPVPGRPSSNPGNWVMTGDYPALALREGRSGMAAFQLDYDDKGKPTACAIARSSGSADLDEATCRIMQERANFTPGRDGKGKPVGGTYKSRVRWIPPLTPLSPSALQRTKLPIVIE